MIYRDIWGLLQNLPEKKVKGIPLMGLGSKEMLWQGEGDPGAILKSFPMAKVRAVEPHNKYEQYWILTQRLEQMSTSPYSRKQVTKQTAV